MENNQYTEADLDLLIDDKLDTQEECAQYPNLCKLLGTTVGRQRVFARIKEVILNDGNSSVEGAIAVVENEMEFTPEND